eukprot:365033-Chlamydomonas_euryale.AAC.7
MLFALDGRGPGGATENIVSQMRAVAEATISELKDRVNDRDRRLAELQALLDATKAQWLAQHQVDRDEMARLNQVGAGKEKSPRCEAARGSVHLCVGEAPGRCVCVMWMYIGNLPGVWMWARVWATC